jgi:tetratricopeptide (TPR) repeat protein
MNKDRHLIQFRVCLYVTWVVFLSLQQDLFSQSTQPVMTRQSSIEAFIKGNFELAFQGFSELLTKYPKDPLYKYYSGVCLLNLNREPEKALLFLSQAQQGSAVVRTVPSDALFWLGRANQVNGKFNEAISSYNSFAGLAGKKAARDFGVDDYVKQCENGKGQIAATRVISEPGEEIKPQAQKPDEIVVPENKGETISVEYGSIDADYDIILSEALGFQFKADSLYKISEELRKTLEKGGNKEKAETRARISSTDELAALFQRKADQKYVEAQTKMNRQTFTDGKIISEQMPSVTDAALKKKTQKQETLFLADSIVKKNKLIAGRDSIKKENTQDKTGNSNLNETPSVAKSEPVIKQTIAKNPEIYSIFEIIPKPVYKADDKIEIDPVIPPGLIYRIQVAVFRNPVAPSYFKGINPVYGFRVSGVDKTNYYAGMFRRIADVNKALVRVRQKGFKDAFVVAFSDGKTVTAARAAVLEKEWGKKPFISAGRPANEMKADTVPPTLSFMVEVMRTAKPVKPESLEAMKKIAGSRNLDTGTSGDGTTIYLIGNFITYESAAEYADLLVRNGYRDAKVSAWLGKKEIPVDTARQLFEIEE